MLGFCSIDNENNNECIISDLPISPRPKRKFTVAVEGNIGSGKTTFLKYFCDSPNVEIFPEPVEMWKCLRGHNTLDLMYKDAQRWSMTFQSYVQLTMLQMHTKKQVVQRSSGQTLQTHPLIKKLLKEQFDQSNSKPIKMMERSIYSAKYCFVENLFQNGRMPAVDHAVISEWFDWIVRNENVNVDLIVYLQATPATCMKRIKKRHRVEETGVPLEYLEQLNKLHEDWLIDHTSAKPAAPVLVLDADKDLDELQREFERRRFEILCGYY